MKKPSIVFTLLLGLKYGVISVLVTAIFLPLPIIVSNFLERVNTIGYYPGPFPVSWICGFSIGTVIPYSMPFLLGGCILSALIAFYPRRFQIKDRGRLSGIAIGAFAVFWGTISFEKFEILDGLGWLAFIGIMSIWGMILFGWIGHRLDQIINQSTDDLPLHTKKDELN